MLDAVQTIIYKFGLVMLKPMFFLPLVLVIVAEHFLLTKVYGKPSSLQRILINPSNSAKTDTVVWSFFYFFLPFFKIFLKFFGLFAKTVNLFVVPGLLVIGLDMVVDYTGWKGFMSEVVMGNQILALMFWLLVHDFSIYLMHMLMHRVPVLWGFHKLHHAATEFNIITGTRVSIGEKALNELSLFFFLTLIIGMPRPETIFAVLFVRRFIDILQHSDLQFDYGVFGYLIASPRFHRMHHSRQREDFDSNYGNIFSCWDYVFNTVAPRYREARAYADDCDLGLSQPAETEEFNQRWWVAILHGTIPHSFLVFRKERKLLKNKS